MGKWQPHDGPVTTHDYIMANQSHRFQICHFGTFVRLSVRSVHTIDPAIFAYHEYKVWRVVVCAAVCVLKHHVGAGGH
jgi:hypothetical protein